MTDPDQELELLRREIDALDRALVDVLVARREVVERIGALKRARGLPAVDPLREARMRAAMVEQGASRGLPEPLVAAVLEAVLADSRALVSGAR
jgi:chorismate mutase